MCLLEIANVPNGAYCARMGTDRKWWERVAEGIRVELARQQKDRNELAAVLGRGRNYVSVRVNGKLPFKLDEIETAAEWLGVDVTSLAAEAASR